MRGSTIGSHMWQALAGPGFEHPWKDDRGSRSADWHAGEVPLRILYRAYFTGTDDDIEYIIQYGYPAEEPDDATWRVLAYNIYMRPRSLFLNGQAIRAGLLPSQLTGYDAFVFSEAFDDEVRSQLLRGLHGEYPHATRILGTDRGVEQDGGVIIVSRWPIVLEDQRVFPMCAGSDCMSAKGVLYAKIERNGRPLHIFGSHTQAWPNDEGRTVRARQFQYIKGFIDSKAIPAEEPVLIAGDLNVDKHRFPDEFRDMLRFLNAQHPHAIGPGFSFDPASNKLASQGEPSEYLDYVLWSGAHMRPLDAINEVRILRSFTEWKELPHEKGLWDLSDHYPVYGRFLFKDPSTLRKPFWAKQIIYGVRPTGDLIWHAHRIPSDPRVFDPKPVKPSPVIQGQAANLDRMARIAAPKNPPPAPAPPQLTRFESPVMGDPVMEEIHKHVTHKWDRPSRVGVGWQGFRSVLPAAQSNLYALTPAGVLKWYRHDGFSNGALQWRGPIDVASGWNAFAKIVPGGDGVLYGIGHDGIVRWHRHTNVADGGRPPQWSGPFDVAYQWQQYRHVFSTGEGVIYAVQPDGQLLWFRHRGYLSGANEWLGPIPVHSGWTQFQRIFSTGEGVIYAQKPDGTLVLYRHEGYLDGTPRWRDPMEVAAGWSQYTHAFPLMTR
ncbi:MAG: tachylectin-related carbohydrate-binding protein [Gammaproteobacteria bacterium]